jgi:phospholipase D1/2
MVRRKSSAFFPQAGHATGGVAGSGTEGIPTPKGNGESWNHLQQMIRYLIFRPESNRLCKFLELGARVRLAAEGSHHGKEGFLIIRSGKGSTSDEHGPLDQRTTRRKMVSYQA